MEGIMIFIYILFGIGFGVVWGFVTKKIIEDKGYDGKNWFWVGFFLGIIGLIIALVKPRKAEN